MHDLKGVKSCRKKNKQNPTTNPLPLTETQIHSLKFQKPRQFLPNLQPKENVKLMNALLDVCNWQEMTEINESIIQRTQEIEQLKKDEIRRRLLEKRAINTCTIFLQQSAINLLFLEIEIKSTKMTALYDTGAEFSLMSYEIYKDITKEDSQIMKYKKGVIKTITAENERTIYIIGSCRLNVIIRTIHDVKINMPITFLITEESPTIPVIFGMNTIIRNEITEILHDKTLRIQGHDINLCAHSQPFYYNPKKTTECENIPVIPINNILMLNINTDSDKENLMVMNIGLEDYWSFCLYDTGCQISLISQDFLHKSNATILDFTKTNISLVSINGKSENNVIGKCKIYVKAITDKNMIISFPIECLIVKDLSNFPAILGLNSIVKNRIECKMHKKALIFQNHKISLLSYPGGNYQPFFAKKKYMIPSQTSQTISFMSPSYTPEDHNDYDESDFLRENQLQINIVYPNHTLEIENKSDNDIYIHPQRILGFITNLEQTHNDSFSLYLKLNEEYNGSKYHKKEDFNNPMEALLPDLQQDIEEWTLEDLKIYGNDDERKRIRELCKEYQHLFAKSKLDVGLTDLMTHRIQIDRRKQVKPTKQIHHHGPALIYAKKCLKMWQTMGIIEPAENPIIVSNLLLIPKTEAGSERFLDRSKAGKLASNESATTFRPVVDLRQTNSLSLNVELPNAILPDSIISKMKDKITSNFDLVNAFFNIELEEQSRRYCCFFFEKEKFQFCRLTQGLSSAPGALSKLLALIFNSQVYEQSFSELSNQEQSFISGKYTGFEDFITYYFDDIWLTTAKDINEHIICLKLLFKALNYGGVLLSPKKCVLFSSEVNVLGLTVQTMTGNILLDHKRGMSFVTMARPNSLYELSSRLSSLNYFRQFIPKLKEITSIFYIMLKESKFCWTSLEEKSWNRLKSIILLDIKLTIPAPHEQLLITCDASNLASSQCLWVLRTGQLYLVSTNSKLFNSSQFMKPIHFKETMSLMYALKQFYPYLLKTQRRVIIFTDARNLLILNRSREHSILANSMSEFIHRMCLIFKFSIFSVPSEINWMADLCSRSMTTSRYIDKKKSEYTISKEYLEHLPEIDYNLNISENTLLKILNNEIEPLKEDTGRRQKNRPKTLTDSFQLYLNSTPEEAFLSATLFLREISRDLCNVKLQSIGIDLGNLDITLKDEYAQKQLLKKNEYPEQKSILKALINSIITKTIDMKFGTEFPKGERTRIKNCLTENFQKMVQDNDDYEEGDSHESLNRINDYLNKPDTIICGKLSAKKTQKFLTVDSENRGILTTFKDEDAGYDFILIDDVIMKPFEKKLIDSGVKIDIPKFHCGILFLRSSAFKNLKIYHGIIDCGFKGTIKFFLENTTNNTLTLNKGGRYVQIIIFPIFKRKLKEGIVKADTIRGLQGFGSTGTFSVHTELEEEEDWLIRVRQLMDQIRHNLNNNNLDVQSINQLYDEARSMMDYDENNFLLNEAEISDDEYVTDEELYTDHSEHKDLLKENNEDDTKQKDLLHEEDISEKEKQLESTNDKETPTNKNTVKENPTGKNTVEERLKDEIQEKHINIDTDKNIPTYKEDQVNSAEQDYSEQTNEHIYEELSNILGDDTENPYYEDTLTKFNQETPQHEKKFSNMENHMSASDSIFSFHPDNMSSTPKNAKDSVEKSVTFNEEQLIQENKYLPEKSAKSSIFKSLNPFSNKLFNTQNDSKDAAYSGQSFETYRSPNKSNSSSDYTDVEFLTLDHTSETNKTSQENEIKDNQKLVNVCNDKTKKENDKETNYSNAFEKHNQYKNSEHLDQRKDSYKCYLDTNSHDAEDENPTRETVQPENMTHEKSINFIHCFHTMIDEKGKEGLVEKEPEQNILEHAIKSANLSITFLENDIINKDHFVRLQMNCDTFKEHYMAAKTKTEKHYCVKKGLLFHTKTGFKLCIPELIIVNTIKYIHTKYAHSSIDQTYKLFNRYYYFPSVLKVIQVYVKNCLTCVLCTWNFSQNHESDTRTVRAKHPLDIISIDIIPRLPKTEDQYTAILIMMDEFSTHLFIYPMKDRSVTEVLKQLKNFISTVGFPKYFRSDQETAIISALKTLASKFPIIPIYSNAYKHNQNNVESGVSFFKKTMNKIIYDIENPQPKTSWYDCAIKTVKIINNTIPSGCKSTKRELFYNIQNIPPFLPKLIMEKENMNLPNDLKLRSKDYENDLKHEKKHEFRLNDLVIIRNHAPTPIGLSSSFNLKMSTDIYIISSIKDGSRTISIKNIESGKMKDVNSEDIMIIPLENYFFQAENIALDKNIEKEVIEHSKEADENQAENPEKEQVEPDALPNVITQPPTESSKKQTRTTEPDQESGDEGPIASRLRPRNTIS